MSTNALSHCSTYRREHTQRLPHQFAQCKYYASIITAHSIRVLYPCRRVPMPLTAGRPVTSQQSMCDAREHSLSNLVLIDSQPTKYKTVAGNLNVLHYAFFDYFFPLGSSRFSSSFLPCGQAPAMSSFSFTPLIAYILISMLDMSFAASIPTARDLVSSPGIRMTSKSVGTSSTPTTVEDFQDLLVRLFFKISNAISG